MKETKENKDIAIRDHDKFNNFVSQSLKSGGSHIVANKSHGKSRLMFSIAEHLIKQDNVRTIIFDGSETWLYAFSKIEVFSIGEHDVSASNLRTIEEFERFELQNWNCIKLALDTRKDLLFRLKTRKPSKRGFFVRTVVNYLDELQRIEKARTVTHENTKAIAYFIEEAQDCFNSRSTARNDTEEFLTVFNEARNNREAFFTASQRLNDFSKTIRSKQLYCIGKLNAEDINPLLRKIERNHNLDFSNMKPRTWFFEGKTFLSPTWTQNGKPHIINRELKQLWLNALPKEKVLSLKDRLKLWLNPSAIKEMAKPLRNFSTESTESESTEEELNRLDREQEESDLREIEEEFPEEW